MHAIKFETTVDEAAVRAMPPLRPLLGRRVELIALQPDPGPPTTRSGKLTFQELLARRVDAAPGAAPLTDADIVRAIAEGALRGDV